MFKAEVVEMIPSRGAGGAKWVRMIQSFIDSQNQIVRYQNDTESEASTMYKGLIQARRLQNYKGVLDVNKRRNDVYLRRKG